MFKNQKPRQFIFLFLISLFIKEQLYSIDPFNLKRFEHHAYIKKSINDDFSKLNFNLNNFHSLKDSTIKIQFKTSGIISNVKPDFRSGITLDGKFGNIAYKIEPIIVNGDNGEDIIGSQYSRADLSFRLANNILPVSIIFPFSSAKTSYII